MDIRKRKCTCSFRTSRGNYSGRGPRRGSSARHTPGGKRRNMAQLTTPIKVSLKNILVATDFSASALSALTCIIPIAKESNSVIHILHVIHPREIPIASPEAEEDISDQAQMDAQRRLGGLENAVGTIPHRTWLREGEVWQAAEDVIRSEHIDLVAVGASGKSDL